MRPQTRFTIEIDDVLEDGPVVVEGIRFDCHATAVLAKHGEDGEPEVDSLHVRPVSVLVGEPEHSLRLNDETWESQRTLYRAIENAIIAAAIRRARLVPLHKWSDEGSEL